MSLDKTDRDYFYLAKTCHAAVPDGRVVEWLQTTVRPVWCALQGVLYNARCLRKVGDIDLQTMKEPTRDWSYVLLAEVAEHAAPWKAVEVEEQALLERGF